jgi:hypothetical protein
MSCSFFSSHSIAVIVMFKSRMLKAVEAIFIANNKTVFAAENL